MTSHPVRIGTRGSKLALAQATMVAGALARAHPGFGADAFETVVIRTTGDQVVDRPLAEIGGKGLFCKEIEAALLAGEIDLAVHSAKDLPTWLPDGLMLAAVLERADPRDVLIARAPCTIDGLPRAAVIGSSSVRRQAQLLARRPDLQVVSIRGNVDTRLRKLAAGEVDATLLAQAGLDRLALTDVPTTPLSTEVMLPAAGQGVVAIEIRADDHATAALLPAIDHADTNRCLTAERALLAALDGSCHTPIGGHALVTGDQLQLRALVARPDGSVVHTTERTGSADDGAALGHDAGTELRTRAGPGFFD